MSIGKLILTLITITLFIQLIFLANEDFPHDLDIVIYGDNRTDHDAHRRVVKSIVEVKPKIVFNTGDLVEDGNRPENWEIFNRIVSDLLDISDFYPTLGNHEYNSPLFFDNFDLPNNERWYSIEANSIHFIVMDSYSETSRQSEQYKWLENDLQNISNKIKFIVAIFHHPIFNTGTQIEDEKGLKETFSTLFEKYGVDVVFSGHDHNYERSFYNNIYYIVTGGGGAPLYDQLRTSPYSQLFIKEYHFCTLSVVYDQLFVEVFDPDFNYLDRFRIRARER